MAERTLKGGLNINKRLNGKSHAKLVGFMECFWCGRLGHMARECTSMPQQGPFSGDPHFKAQAYQNDLKDNDPVEMMDCSLGKSS